MAPDSYLSESGREENVKMVAGTIFAVLLSFAPLLAQVPCARGSQVTDQERIVQAEIQSRIDESMEAAEANDFAAKVHYFVPDLTLKLADGTVLNRKQVEEGMKRDADWTLAVSDQTTVKIECLELQAKEATVVTNQHFVRTVPDRKDGSPHELVTNVTHRETWVYTAAGWLTKRIEELKQGPTYLDGKLFVE